MKVTTNNKEVFKPISITIDLETEDEAIAMYSLFNYTPVSDSIGGYGIDHAAIRRAIKEGNGDPLNYREIHTAISKRISRLSNE